MEIRAFSDKPTSVNIEILLGTNSYRLFRNFIKQNANNNMDTAIKMLCANLDKQLDEPDLVENSGQQPQLSATQQQALNTSNTNLAAAVGNLSQKLDMVIKSIAAIQNKHDGSLKEVKFDTEVLDGYARRIDGMIKAILQDKLVAFTGAQELLQKADDISNKINDVKQAIAAIDVQKVATAIQIAQAPQVSTVIPQPESAQLPSVSGVGVEVKNIESKGKNEDSPAPEKPTTTAVVGDDLVRYPTNSKSVQPKCFGHFLAKKDDAETPCPTCVLVNECKDAKEKPVTTTKPAREIENPDCFGHYRADLDCSVCRVSASCQEKS